jgi:hypothetical protein
MPAQQPYRDKHVDDSGENETYGAANPATTLCCGLSI